MPTPTTKAKPRAKAPEFTNLRDLFVHQLRDLYSAEQQILKDGLPKMIKTASDSELVDCLTAHLAETKEQIARLNEIAEILEVKLAGHTCEATKGLLKEAAEWLEQDAADAVMDAGIIGDGQSIEHYEIARYGAAHAYALKLGEDECAELLATTLEEEKAANEALSAAAESVNRAALGDDE